MKWKALALATLPAVAAASITYVVASAPRLSAGVGAEKHDEHEGETSAPRIPGVRFTAARIGAGWDTIELPARVTIPPERNVRVGSRVSGRLVSVFKTVGDVVRRGEVLAEVASPEVAEARAKRLEAAARLESARKALEREQAIVDLGAVRTRPVEEARAAEAAAQAALAEARGAAAEGAAEVARAEAELAQCEARLARARDLYADQLVSKQDLEAAEAERARDRAALSSAKARLEAAQRRVRSAQDTAELNSEYAARERRIFSERSLDLRAMQSARSLVDTARVELSSADARLRALGASPTGFGDTVPAVSPISGRLLTREAHRGAAVQPSDTLFTVADLGSVWVEADVHEKDLAKVRRGCAVEIRTGADTDRTIAGRIDWVSETLSAVSRTARARCVVANSDGRLRSDMSAVMTVLLARKGSVALAPRASVLDDAGSKVVYTACTDCPEDRASGRSTCGSYDRIVVRTGSVRGSDIEILDGLTPGTMVVSEGQQQIRAAMSAGTLRAGCTDH